MTTAETEKLLLLLEQCFPNGFSSKAKNKRLAVSLVLEPYSYATAKKAVLEYARTRPEFVPTPPELAAICNRYEPIEESAVAAEPEQGTTTTAEEIAGLYRTAVHLGLDLNAEHKKWLKEMAVKLGVAEI